MNYSYVSRCADKEMQDNFTVAIRIWPLQYSWALKTNCERIRNIESLVSIEQYMIPKMEILFMNRASMQLCIQWWLSVSCHFQSTHIHCALCFICYSKRIPWKCDTNIQDKFVPQDAQNAISVLRLHQLPLLVPFHYQGEAQQHQITLAGTVRAAEFDTQTKIFSQQC